MGIQLEGNERPEVYSSDELHGAGYCNVDEILFTDQFAVNVRGKCTFAKLEALALKSYT